MQRIICLMLFLYSVQLNAQTNYKDLGVTFTSSSTYSMFPDSLRNIEPRIYQGKTYSAKEHYRDSSFLVFIPKNFKATKPYEIVVWMHGWNNNIDSTIQFN